jgi:hypothetical protein
MSRIPYFSQNRAICSLAGEVGVWPRTARSSGWQEPPAHQQLTVSPHGPGERLLLKALSVLIVVVVQAPLPVGDVLVDFLRSVLSVTASYLGNPVG